MPSSNHAAVNNLGFWQLHGMEEVVGSIPTRSTNHFSDLESSRKFLKGPERSNKRTPHFEPAFSFNIPAIFDCA
jgi:hypothetical protein